MLTKSDVLPAHEVCDEVLDAYVSLYNRAHGFSPRRGWFSDDLLCSVIWANGGVDDRYQWVLLEMLSSGLAIPTVGRAERWTIDFSRVSREPEFKTPTESPSTRRADEIIASWLGSTEAKDR